MRGLAILSAVYGAADSFVDVRDVVERSLFLSQTRKLMVGNKLAEKDPMPGHVKKLTVRYRIGRVEGESSAYEHNWLSIPSANPAEVHYTLSDHLHLGDSLHILSAMDYVSRASNIRFRLTPTEKTKAFVSCFDPLNMTLDGNASIARNADVELFWGLAGKYTGNAEALKFLWHACDIYGLPHPEDINRLPYFKEPRDDLVDTVLCQADGRFCGFCPEEKFMRALEEEGVTKFKFIGGPDSKRYFGDKHEYLFGDLEFIVRALLGCKLCMVVDSGIMNVAGYLNVPTVIVGRLCAKHDKYNIIKQIAV